VTLKDKYTVIYASTLTTDKSPSVYQEVHNERERAHAKHGAYNNSREVARWGDFEWLPILMEELGEVAHEFTYDTDPDGLRERVRKELIQVAAMACAWIDAIDRADRA
jgi:NTP pyrophosphatase (non-canonical NTP hydrolase)